MNKIDCSSIAANGQRLCWCHSDAMTTVNPHGAATHGAVNPHGGVTHGGVTHGAVTSSMPVDNKTVTLGPGGKLIITSSILFVVLKANQFPTRQRV